MFIPEIYIRRWDDFEKILKKSKIRVYSLSFSYSWTLVLQAYTGEAVFTHEEPVYASQGKKFLLGIPYEDKELDTYSYPNAKTVRWDKIQSALSLWRKKILTRILTEILIPEYGLIEGNFVGVVPIAQEREY